jgi:deoxyadenosine/deoxycytidine kinase
MPIIIELVGAGGCGKTYIASKLAEKLKYRCVISKDIKIDWGLVIGFISRNVIKTLNVLIFIFNCKQRSIRDYRASIVTVLTYQLRKYYALRNGIPIIIFDEGLLHKFRRIRARSRIHDLSYRSLNAKLRKMIFSPLDILVLINCNVEVVAKRRIEIRKTSTQDEDYRGYMLSMKDSFYRSAQMTEDDINSASREIGFKTIIIDNSSDTLVDEEINRIINNALNLGSR